jgi:hypothetical protein
MFTHVLGEINVVGNVERGGGVPVPVLKIVEFENPEDNGNVVPTGATVWPWP